MPWYKGNLHCHSSNSDGAAPPQEIARYYKKLGYDFIGISDHNSYTAVESYARDADILGIPCCEYTGKDSCHVLAAGVTQAVAPNLESDDIWERMSPDKHLQSRLPPNGPRRKVMMLQDGINKTIATGGIPIVCHPLWKWAFNHQEMLELEHLTHFELCNASPDCNSMPLPGKSYADEMWDAMLSNDIRVIGMASDDAHTYTAPYAPFLPIGGRGWNMIKAPALTQTDILRAIRHGHCYATTGVILKEYTVTNDRISVEIMVSRNREKHCIQFFGQGGRELQLDYASRAEYCFRGDETYVRCRISSTMGNWAWTQPVFMDELQSQIEWTNRS